MCFFFSFLPATFWAVLGYFILFSSAKVDGPIRTLGQALATWVFVIVVFILLGGAFVTVSGMCSMDALMRCAEFV